MGSPKALLALGDTTLVDAVIARLRPIFHRVLVVTRHSGSLMSLDAEVLMDQRPDRGPLVGLARGLSVSDAPWCFVVGCDMPFLNARVIHRMVESLSECEILVPNVGGNLQPLHAFYSRQCLPLAEKLLDQGITSVQALFLGCSVRTIEAAELLHLDPDLLSYWDLDTEGDYQAALNLIQGHDRQEVSL